MQDFMTPEREARLLTDWEKAVRETPMKAWNSGPPSWLVAKEYDPKGKEPFTKVAGRVKARYFPGGVGGAMAAEGVYIKTEGGRRIASERGVCAGEVLQGSVTEGEMLQSVTLCPVCGVRPIVGRQKVCSGACRVKQSRRRGS